MGGRLGQRLKARVRGGLCEGEALVGCRQSGLASLCLFPAFLAGSAELPVPVSVGTFGVRWGVQAVGKVLVAVTRTVGPVGS